MNKPLYQLPAPINNRVQSLSLEELPESFKYVFKNVQNLFEGSPGKVEENRADEESDVELLVAELEAFVQPLEGACFHGPLFHGLWGDDVDVMLLLCTEVRLKDAIISEHDTS